MNEQQQVEKEEILYECHGKIVQKEIVGDVKLLVKNARIFVTNKRIVAQGTLEAKGGADTALPIFLWGISGRRKRAKSKNALIESSTNQELPLDGYQFKTQNHNSLKRTSDGIKYLVNLVNMEDLNNVSNSQMGKAMRKVTITLTHPDRAQINNLFEVLCIDINQIMNAIRELLDMELDQKRKGWAVLGELHPRVFKSEGIHHFSASDYLYIVEETYKLDPEFFMTSIYPKMMSWKYAKYISEIDVKWEINTLVNKLNKESGI